jgi:hypothetical protein
MLYAVCCMLYALYYILLLLLYLVACISGDNECGGYGHAVAEQLAQLGTLRSQQV